MKFAMCLTTHGHFHSASQHVNELERNYKLPEKLKSENCCNFLLKLAVVRF